MIKPTSRKDIPLTPQEGREIKAKRDVFRILFLSMVAFGILMGAAFPQFVQFYFPESHSISLSFALMCLAAGIIVGVANYILFSLVVSKELRFLVNGMNQVNNQISAAIFSKQFHPESYKIEVKTNDMLGQVTQAFNTMSKTVEQRFAHEASFRDSISNLSANIDLDTTSNIILSYFIETSCITSGILYGKIEEEMVQLSSHDVDVDDTLSRKLEALQDVIKDTIDSGEIHSIDPETIHFDWASITSSFVSQNPLFIRIIPLIADKSTVGLVIASCGTTDVPEALQQETLKTYSSYMAPYLQNALLHNKIQEMASYDSLTHLLNRRFGWIRLEEEFSAAVRYEKELSAIMVDIDKFKQVNDTYGHEAGDVVLRNVASAIILNLRNEEVICRYGGEEFLIILPMADLSKASLVAERLRLLIEKQTCLYKDKPLSVTISLGVSSLSSLETRNENDLINAADTALYHAKNLGRNRVALFQNNEAVLLTQDTSVHSGVLKT